MNAHGHLVPRSATRTAPPVAVLRRVPRTFRPERFTLRPAGGGGFAAVEAALARKLTALAERPECLAVNLALLDRRAANLYTQTLVDQDAGAWVEAVSNTYITNDAHLLGADQHRMLAAFGFAPPTDRQPNHTLVLGPPVDWRRVAGLLVQPLEAVYGADARSEIEVKVLDVGQGAPWLPDDPDTDPG